MALRDQPYLPLYVQDFLTDEKLAECSAAANGVYIRLMCLMHKSDQYGSILLKQKYKQTSEPIKNFATQIAKQMPFDFHTVARSLEELVNEKVLLMEGDILTQKRMVKDNKISESRAKTGAKGGAKTANKFASKFAKAKSQANTEYENEDEFESEDEDDLRKGGAGEKQEPEMPFNSVEFKVAWYGWKSHLVDKKSPYQTFSAEQGGLDLLLEIAGTDENKAIHTLNYCRKQNWKSLHLDKDYGKISKTKPTFNEHLQAASEAREQSDEMLKKYAKSKEQ
jgi:hypothetical protein